MCFLYLIAGAKLFLIISFLAKRKSINTTIQIANAPISITAKKSDDIIFYGLLKPITCGVETLLQSTLLVAVTSCVGQLVI